MADGLMGKETFSADDIYRAQRTEAGKRYDRLRDETRDRMQDKEFRERRDASIRQMRSVSPGLVHKNTFMSNLSVQYKNDDYVGLQLMPELFVDKRSDSFVTYGKRDRNTNIDDRMSTRSEANELSQTRGEDSYQVQDYGLTDWLPAATETNEDPAFDEMLDLTEGVMEAEAFKTEKRIATALTTAANYGGNTVTLSGADQWSDASGGNPLKNIQDAIAATWSGRGPGDLVGFCSLDVWNVLARHAQLADIFKYTVGGLTKMDRMAQELGLAKLVVAAAREDTANSGQTASFGRIWGKHFGVVRVARRPSLRNAAFGYTIRMRNHPNVQTWFDPKKGVEGAYFTKVGLSETQKVVAGDTGYLIVNAIA